ncbi:S-adenosyl-L-methionine-dependent methyltransferase [Sistotremastrum suecicum HHB10207 ss-3]|uniref:S-adenosyl-L-methionine-dependent methyltransferase n=1 Tax=Sistotremastrum suecicum HHB10207 ss-3 TaxID=1314776 RepID=A0A166F9R3_9AGAM|nr:S-adenosyl-L-methionine-dependent methyltransferase [Sistotremastrum suecicum HHB10207 ss-3]
MESSSVIDSLLFLITNSTRTLQYELAAANVPEPNLSATGAHPWDTTTPPRSYWDARKTLLGALGMMAAVVQNPQERVMTDTLLYHRPAALSFVTKVGIADIIARLEGGLSSSRGVHIEHIAHETGLSAAKIAITMRYLCSHHIFEEVAPDHFSNNRLSATLLEGELTKGFVELWSDVSLKASTKFSKVLADPVAGNSIDSLDSPFAEAFAEDPQTRNGINGHNPSKSDYWHFLNSPGNEDRLKLFAHGMRANSLMNGGGKGLLWDFPWSRFDHPESVIVELGSGIGHLCMQIMQVLKYAHFQNQDRPEVCTEGEKIIARSCLSADQKSRISFLPHDFFVKQPVTGASLYILSNVLHDWEDSKVITILQNTRNAMSPASRLVLIEALVSYPTIQHDTEESMGTVSNPSHQFNQGVAPAPLLSNYGVANSYVSHQHMEMILLGNAMDRNIDQYLFLAGKAGLHLVDVYTVRRHVSVVELRVAE